MEKELIDLIRGEKHEQMLEELYARYSEKGRHHHSMNHVNVCLEELAKMKKDPSLQLGSEHEIMPMVYAILFHDSVYNPREKDDNNVKASANLWKSWAERMGVNEQIIKKTYTLITVTDHKTKPETLHEKLMVDLDLVIFGKDEETFIEYDQNIRREYSFVDWDVYREKRAEILEGFLEKDHIYNTSKFQELYDDKAKKNLRMCITRLRNKDTKDYLLSDQ